MRRTKCYLCNKYIFVTQVYIHTNKHKTLPPKERKKKHTVNFIETLTQTRGRIFKNPKTVSNGFVCVGISNTPSLTFLMCKLLDATVTYTGAHDFCHTQPVYCTFP